MKSLSLKPRHRWYLGSLVNDQPSTVAEWQMEANIQKKLSYADFQLLNGFGTMADEQRDDESAIGIDFEEAEFSFMAAAFFRSKHAGQFKAIARECRDLIEAAK